MIMSTVALEKVLCRLIMLLVVLPLRKAWSEGRLPARLDSPTTSATWSLLKPVNPFTPKSCIHDASNPKLSMPTLAGAGLAVGTIGGNDFLRTFSKSLSLSGTELGATGAIAVQPELRKPDAEAAALEYERSSSKLLLARRIVDALSLSR